MVIRPGGMIQNWLEFVDEICTILGITIFVTIRAYLVLSVVSF